MPLIKLIIARHGNTFETDQTPTRIGARTDMQLTQAGEEQALKLGHHLKSANRIPDFIYTSCLRRTIDTARLACVAMKCHAPSEQLDFLNEIDYGVDENQPENKVIDRLGEATLKNWDKNGIMPESWTPRPPEILLNWQNFLKDCANNHNGQTIMTVTSNGIARFALAHTENGRDFPLKLSTGAYGILEFDKNWRVSDWNLRP
ncbi:MAG: histidine phosphatase family protein [Alphaproteobacteria bacterium]|nr:histidine phosphatase family protein [Alphaproteobacteria bacterium]MCB9985116.1 histidine phosphatase family protein [Micavibrio sp.]HPQ50867.1 histidine phosphatase family protein [Alphaproteobacteria bacterium]